MEKLGTIIVAVLAAGFIFGAGILYGECSREKTPAHENAENMIEEAEDDRSEALETALEACPEGNFVACKHAVAKYKQAAEQDRDAVCLLIKGFTGALRMGFDCSPKKKSPTKSPPPLKKSTKPKKPPTSDAGSIGPPAPDSSPPPPDAGPPPADDDDDES
ncbi:MAG: hypothetical protein HQ530_02970 [Parcubacteria group bacterium]|nr:hypothetical protein [Parcubacteria group bacterium]